MERADIICVGNLGVPLVNVSYNGKSKSRFIGKHLGRTSWTACPSFSLSLLFMPLGAGLLRGAVDGISTAAVGELQLHKGGISGDGIVAAQHVRFAVSAGGFAVQGKGDSVKQRGFARAGIAADQEQAAGAKAGQIQCAGAGIRAKGANCLLYTSPSPRD